MRIWRGNPRDNQPKPFVLPSRLASGTMSAAEGESRTRHGHPHRGTKGYRAAYATCPDSAESVVQILRAAARRAPQRPRGARTALAVFLSMRGHIDESWKLLHGAIQSGRPANSVALGLISPG
jgi:hypothetical protein